MQETNYHMTQEQSKHDQMVSRQKLKFGKDWIVATEVGYGAYRFDILAINIKTKEMQVVEVDMCHTTSIEKVKFAETFAKIKVIRCDERNAKDNMTATTYHPLLKVINNVLRLAILEFLATEGEKTYTEIKHFAKMPTNGGGKFMYHMNMLLKHKLIQRQNNNYKVTEKGKQTISTLNNLQQM